MRKGFANAAALALLVISASMLYRSLQPANPPVAIPARPPAGKSHAYLEYLFEGREQLARAERGSSAWLNEQTDRFIALIENQPADVLVLPFASGPLGFDPSARSLMAHRLAGAIEDHTGLRVADVFNVQNAMRWKVRLPEQAVVEQLINASGAGVVIEPLVFRAGVKDRSLSLVIRKHTITRSNGTVVQKGVEYLRFGPLPFDDDHLPHEAFTGLLPDILRSLGLEPREPERPAGPDQAAAVADSPVLPAIPASLTALVADSPGTPALQRAARLTFLGMLYPQVLPRARERLFERALLALDEAGPEAPGYRLLKARALFYLHRRPAAVPWLAQASTPAELAFRAFMDGNAEAMLAQQPAIESAAERLMSAIEHYRLLSAATESIDDKALLERILQTDGVGDWRFLLKAALEEGEHWYRPPTLELKAWLDRHYPLEGSTLAEVMQAKLLTGVGDGADDGALGLAVEHVGRVLAGEAGHCCQPRQGLRTEDMLLLIQAHAEASAVLGVIFQLETQGRPASALSRIENLRSTFDGHPGLAAVEALARYKLIEKSTSLERRNMVTGTVERALDANARFGSQNPLTNRLHEGLSRLGSYPESRALLSSYPWSLFSDVLDRMFPPRGYWRSGSSVGIVAQQAWDYAHDDPASLYEGASALHVLDRDEEARQLLEANSHRYQSDPRLVEARIDYYEGTGDKAQVARLAREAVASGSSRWRVYRLLGEQQVEAGEYDDALATFMKFPSFDADANANRVALSNLAYEAGSLLFWRGAIAQARPLYAMSAGYRTGSGGSITSAQRLALLDRDWAGAAQLAARRGERYGSSYGYRDYLSLLYVTGFGEQADTALEQLARASNAPHWWSAAVVGAKVQGLTDAEVNARLRHLHALAAPNSRLSLAGRAALQHYFTDHAATEEHLAIITELEADFRPRIEPNQLAQLSQGIAYAPSTFKHPATPVRLAVGASADAELVYFARALLAMRAGRYEEAFTVLLDRGNYYPTRPSYSDGYIFSYLAQTALRSGNGDWFREQFPATNLTGPGGAFDLALAQALLAQDEGNQAEALEWLRRAFGVRPHMEYRPFKPWYQLLEVCEWLHEASGDPAYIELALDWARKYQQIEPVYAFAWAFEARYGTEPQARTRALAHTLHLDADSHWIRDASDEDIRAARAWLDKNKPFSISVDTGGGSAAADPTPGDRPLTRLTPAGERAVPLS